MLRTKVVEKTPNVETFGLYTHLHTGEHIPQVHTDLHKGEHIPRVHTHLHKGEHTHAHRCTHNKQTNLHEHVGPLMAKSQRKPVLVGQLPLPNMCFPIHHGGMGRIRITQT